MLTVYLTSQPVTGALRAKAVYRLLGTLIGAVAMVAIVPNLVDAPELTTAAISLWVAFCLYVSLLDRTPHAYTFALSGYTAALIGFPSVLNPDGGVRYGDRPRGGDHARDGVRRARAQPDFSTQRPVAPVGEAERRVR